MDFRALSKLKKSSLYIIGLVLLIGTCFAIFQILKSNYVVLYQDENLANVSLITEQLQEKNIEFNLLDQGHTLLVPESKLNLLKVELAQINQKASSAPGFELFDNIDYSMTEHAQKITFQRAIQGELEHTLKSYEEITDARVHITLPEKHLFSDNDLRVKASISLWLLEDVVFTQDQVRGVQELVASSVERLETIDVVVLDANGREMSLGKANDGAQMLSLNDHTEIEQMLSDKAMNLLLLYFNSSQLAVSVTVSIDHTHEKKVIRSLLVNEANEGVITRKKEATVGLDGVDKKKGEKVDRKLEVEYQHGTEVAEHVRLPGAIQQVSVAVAIASDVNKLMIGKIEKLIFAGLGLNTLRGDLLSVEILPVMKMKSIQLPQQKVIEPIKQILKPNNLNGGINYWLYGFIALMIIILLIAGVSLTRRTMNAQEKEMLQLQFDDWLNIKEASHHVK